jgi:hypothetical protein
MANARDLATAAASYASRGLMVKVAVVGGVLILVLLMFVPLLVGDGQMGAAACEGTATGNITPPAISVTTEQEDLARTADQVATDMAMPGRALLIILMTGYQESGMKNLDHGDRDSVGWLQQRPSQGWGTIEQIMDPAFAAESFYQALRSVAGWDTMSLNDAAQAVQRSGFPDAYAKHEDAARALASAIGADLTHAGDAYGDGTLVDGDATGGDTTTEGTCTGEPLPGNTGPVDGNWTPENPVICPDPTNGRGCITPRTNALVAAIRTNGMTFPSIYCWDAHAWNPKSDHATGKACDIAYSSGWPNQTQIASGNEMATWLISVAGNYGVKYLIWQGQIWYATTGTWTTYDGAGGLYNVNTPSGGHYDHVHVSLF